MKKLVGALAGMAMMGLVAGAYAQGGSDMGAGSAGSSQSGGMGSSGSMGSSAGSSTSKGGTAGSMMGVQQLEGRVLKADKSSITIEHLGAAIPLTVQSSTAFQGVKSAKDIKEGQQVRASFELKGTKNELTSVEVLPGAGGAGGTGKTGKKSSGGAGSSGSESMGGSSGGASGGSDQSGGY